MAKSNSDYTKSNLIILYNFQASVQSIKKIKLNPFFNQQNQSSISNRNPDLDVLKNIYLIRSERVFILSTLSSYFCAFFFFLMVDHFSVVKEATTVKWSDEKLR